MRIMCSYINIGWFVEVLSAVFYDTPTYAHSHWSYSSNNLIDILQTIKLKDALVYTLCCSEILIKIVSRLLE